MDIINCFCVRAGMKKSDKGKGKSSSVRDFDHGLKAVQVTLEQPAKSSEAGGPKSSSTSFSVPMAFGISGSSRFKAKVMSHESPAGREVEEVAYEGEDEHDEHASMKRSNSDFDFQVHSGNLAEEHGQPRSTSDFFGTELHDVGMSQKFNEDVVGEIKSGHVSDPGIGKAKFWASPKLKRSCSDLEKRDVQRKLTDQMSRPHSCEEMQRLAEGVGVEEAFLRNVSSPVSVISHCSADKVMLKKHSSSQILPSRSRKLWWKLFLWSHRNLHKPLTVKPQPFLADPAFSQQGGGYTSDTLEPRGGTEPRTPSSFTGESLSTPTKHGNGTQERDSFISTAFGLWPQNQWVAFTTGPSPLSRVDEWVKELATQSPQLTLGIEDCYEDEIVFPPSPDAEKSPLNDALHSSVHPHLNLPEEVLYANNVIRSLNSSSTVAHISGIGLKVIPALSCYTSLRSVNLSGNFIVHISSGHLPKGLHTLDLSRNKIATIEGLRELTRLRVLDLSYNRISRIGHGLSNCSFLKELYLAGNKIGDVEGLHRLLKLTILDLSFNKISTTKALGQVVANYNSLLALNLLGNPIQSNISEEQLRKAICGLLPKLAYLNKLPVNPQKAREIAPETLARVALGKNDRSIRRKTAKRVSHGRSSSPIVHRNSGNVSHRGKHRSKTTTHHLSHITRNLSGIASSSH